MLAHLCIYVKDLKASEKFYTEALSPLGYKVTNRYDEHKVIGLTDSEPNAKADFWIVEDASKVSSAAHFAFAAKDRNQVDTFHTAGLKAGGECNGKPGLREMYGPGYYAAYVKDLDGHNVELVFYEQK
ncbi:glyoxalase-like domain protein [Atractiella rhizophila]|nr:glyoxalase-like domain protein [Atractiella rhizophila]